MRKAFIACLVGAATLAVPFRASALSPTISSFHFEGSSIPVEDCGSFEVLLSFSHDETITTFYDKTGAPTRDQIRFVFSGTLTNSVTGKSADENGAYTITIDLTSDHANVVGLILVIRLEGVGVVTLELGHVTVEQPSVINSPEILDGASFVCSILS
jgi:hypothetical protein